MHRGFRESNRGKLDRNMRGNFDYEELNRQCSDAGVHLDVEAVQVLFFDATLGALCAQVEEPPRELITLSHSKRSRLFLSENAVSFVVHEDKLGCRPQY